MHRVHITKLSQNEFHFEYEYDNDKSRIEGLKEFVYNDRRYKVLYITETFDLSGYHAYMVYAELIK